MKYSATLQEKNGIWQIKFAYKENGKWKGKWKSTGLKVKDNKKKLAKEMMEEELRRLNESQIAEFNSQRDMLFSDFVEMWLETKRNTLKSNTFYNYNNVVKNDIVPYFKEKKILLRDISVLTLQPYYNYLSNERNLSGKSVHKRHTIIHQALKYAVGAQLLVNNPSDYVITPSKKPYKAKFYNTEQLQALLNCCEKTTLESVIKLAAIYGLRRSEVLGLTWADVDFIKNEIHIERTAVSIGGGRYEEEVAKTKASHRTLPLTDDMIIFLKQLRKRQMEDQLIFGNKYHNSNAICRYRDGRAIKPDYVTRNFKELLIKNNLPIIRFHDLRHSSASMLLSMGYSLKQIQDWLGHSCISITSDIYGHLESKEKIIMSENINKVLKFVASE